MNIKEYEIAYSYFDKIVKLVLYSFAIHTNEPKDIIIRNFIAKGNASLQSIFSLWNIKNYNDCWILYRCILERLFYLRSLEKKNDYKDFDDWSFKVQFEMNNKIFSDKDYKHKIDPKDFMSTKEERNRYNSIRKQNIEWKRPNMDEIAKEMDLIFLYKFGYDHASSFVHPMANDGQEDFSNQTNITLNEDLFKNKIMVINNSCLITSLLVREGMNNCTLGWRNIMFDFFDHFNNSLKSGSDDYKNAFIKIVSLDR